MISHRFEMHIYENARMGVKLITSYEINALLMHGLYTEPHGCIHYIKTNIVILKFMMRNRERLCTLKSST